ncbi:MAG TPA: penicillin-binding transpeptidase domain-containing protein [Blastocatellia bacterium]|nr:penicillin-binding transpeptidase domain-containing protein [Blastocatellia bacterium]
MKQVPVERESAGLILSTFQTVSFFLVCRAFVLDNRMFDRTAMKARASLTAFSLMVVINTGAPYRRVVEAKHANALEVSASRRTAPSPCAKSLARWCVCEAANQRALEILNANHAKAFIVVQDVQTGALVAFAATDPSELDVTTPVNPLSLSKLFLAASWWDNRQPDSKFDNNGPRPDGANPPAASRLTIHEVLVRSSDSGGRQMAVALRRSVGGKTVLNDLKRYGVAQTASSLKDDSFWGSLAPEWKSRLIPVAASVSLDAKTTDADWADSLSVGEARMSVTALQVSRFLQAVGNSGLMVIPTAGSESEISSMSKGPASGIQGPKRIVRILREHTALRLQSAMLDVVQHGTARNIARSLDGTGWRIGGKTGSGVALLPKGSQVDGWFAGLLFNRRGRARFTIATFVRSGRYGGEAAAHISTELARYIIGRDGPVGN